MTRQLTAIIEREETCAESQGIAYWYTTIHYPAIRHTAQRV